jgi:hypothetical protein
VQETKAAKEWSDVFRTARDLVFSACLRASSQR